jgi:ribonuclease Z
VSAASVDRICVTHFHGDHCLGLPGIIMRRSLDAGSHPVAVHYPASGQAHFERLRFATAGQEHVPVDARPVTGPGVVHRDDLVTIRAEELSHRVDAVGYRVEEPDRRHMIVDRLDAMGITGPAIGRLQEHGSIEHRGRTVHVEEVSEHRRGQVFAFVMDTRWCPGALRLAEGTDLLVCEATFLDVDADMADGYGHLTARQAGRLAREAGARRLVLTHLSRRYGDERAFVDEAAGEFDGDIVLAEDLMRVPVPPRA